MLTTYAIYKGYRRYEKYRHDQPYTEYNRPSRNPLDPNAPRRIPPAPEYYPASALTSVDHVSSQPVEEPLAITAVETTSVRAPPPRPNGAVAIAPIIETKQTTITTTSTTTRALALGTQHIPQPKLRPIPPPKPAAISAPSCRPAPPPKPAALSSARLPSAATVDAHTGTLAAPDRPLYGVARPSLPPRLAQSSDLPRPMPIARETHPGPPVPPRVAQLSESAVADPSLQRRNTVAVVPKRVNGNANARSYGIGVNGYAREPKPRPPLPVRGLEVAVANAHMTG